MSDNKNQRDGRDRSRVSGEEKYEVQHLAEKFNVSAEEVRRIIGEVGNSREKIEERLRGGNRR
jgi:DeoR/GlpR family transcriptional regulator of sugar metabolism